MSQDKKLWSVDDLAEYVGVPVATVYRWSSRGDGPPGYRVGRHLRFRPVEVERWLDGRRHDERPVPAA
ncbi:MAG: helix-turn-helix domain-containing protein [Actinomycetota bacterium]|nr:helix-turn-helix domain-containing protein [Actinomycetota bacterium]